MGCNIVKEIVGKWNCSQARIKLPLTPLLVGRFKYEQENPSDTETMSRTVFPESTG